MNLNTSDIRKLAAPTLLALVFLASGAALNWYAKRQLVNATASLAVATSDRMQAREKLNRISEEEREVTERIEVYRRLRDLNVLGKERRLSWVDSIQSIRVNRELLDVRYRIDPQKLLLAIDGKPGSVSFYSSAIRVNLALLHEGDLLAFLDDLRNAGNAYVSVRQCAISRSGTPADAPSLAPRLQADCQIELITVIDGGAKS